MWLLVLFMYSRSLVHPQEADAKITDEGNFHHFFPHLVEGLTKQFSRDPHPPARLRSELTCVLMLYFRGCDMILAFLNLCGWIVKSVRTDDMSFWFIVAAQEIIAVSSLRCSSLLPAASPSVLLLEVTRPIPASVFWHFYSLCLEAGYQPGPLSHLFQVFIQRVPYRFSEALLSPFLVLLFS